jgi:hypothetical protein
MLGGLFLARVRRPRRPGRIFPFFSLPPDLMDQTPMIALKG